MSADRPTLVDPPIEPMLEACENSKFTLVRVAAARAREINRYYTSLGSGMTSEQRLIPPQINSNSNKALTMAFEELSLAKLEVHRKSADEVAQDEAAEAERVRLAAEKDSRDLTNVIAATE